MRGEGDNGGGRTVQVERKGNVGGGHTGKWDWVTREMDMHVDMTRAVNTRCVCVWRGDGYPGCGHPAAAVNRETPGLSTRPCCSVIFLHLPGKGFVSGSSLKDPTLLDLPCCPSPVCSTFLLIILSFSHSSSSLRFVFSMSFFPSLSITLSFIFI